MTIPVMHNRLGLVDSNIVALDSAANDYDEKLTVGRHDSGQWAVYVAMERPQKPYPVFVLNEPLPSPHELIERLRASDMMRQDLRKQVNDANTAWEAEIDRKGRAEISQAAEVVEYIGRKEGVYQETQSRRRIRHN